MDADGGEDRMDVTSGLHAFVAEQLGVEEAELYSQLSLVDAFGADSLDMLDLALSVEGRFGIDLPERLWAQVRSFADLAELVATRIDARGAPPAGRVVTDW
jgi:acyl carrier protein